MSNEITIAQQPSQTVMSVQDQMNWAKAVSGAGILPQAYRGKPADVLVAVGFGQSMGLSPAESLYRINVINGKPTMGAELIAAQVRKAGHKLRLKKDEKNLSVTATIVRADDPDYPISVTRDRQWAEQMGLSGKDNYKKQPMTMLTWRAISAVAREACPEALFGVAYTPDEMTDMVRVDSVEEATAAPVEAPSQPIQSGEMMASKQQAERINNLLRKAGVASADMAKTAFRALCGQEHTSASQLSQIDAENLLSAPDLVVKRTREALRSETGDNNMEPDGKEQQ